MRVSLSTRIALGASFLSFLACGGREGADHRDRGAGGTESSSEEQPRLLEQRH